MPSPLDSTLVPDDLWVMKFRNVAAAIGLLVLTAAGVHAGATGEDYGKYLDSLYRGSVPVMQPEELELFLRSNPDALVLDVRSRPERSVSFLEGSEFHDFDSFAVDSLPDLPRDTPIVAYCAVGYRSERVGEMLMEAGFTDVRHLYGGIIEWHNRGLSLSNGNGPVHGYAPRWGRYVADGNVVYDPPVE